MSLLTAARATVVIDVDSMDPVVAATHAPAVEKFSDMTSNQAIACFEALRPERSDVLDAAVHAAKAESAEVLDEEHTAVLALDHFTVLLAKSVFPYVTGRVHAQTSPSAAYNTEKTIAHAKRLVAIFEKNGIAKDRVCIKIPATPESLIACQYLEKIGIRTLGTCLFSVSQAIAASQAKCLYIAPYFNELRVHFEPGVWKEYTDTARDHPMSQVIANIVRTYREIGSETLVMPASIVTAAEVIALVRLKPDHLTLSGPVLDVLASLPATELHDVMSGTANHDLQISPSASAPEGRQVDYLIDGGAHLRDALALDKETARKLQDALRIFSEKEDQLKSIIKQRLRGEGL